MYSTAPLPLASDTGSSSSSSETQPAGSRGPDNQSHDEIFAWLCATSGFSRVHGSARRLSCKRSVDGPLAMRLIPHPARVNRRGLTTSHSKPKLRTSFGTGTCVPMAASGIQASKRFCQRGVCSNRVSDITGICCGKYAWHAPAFWWLHSTVVVADHPWGHPTRPSMRFPRGRKTRSRRSLCMARVFS